MQPRELRPGRRQGSALEVRRVIGPKAALAVLVDETLLSAFLCIFTNMVILPSFPQQADEGCLPACLVLYRGPTYPWVLCYSEAANLAYL